MSRAATGLTARYTFKLDWDPALDTASAISDAIGFAMQSQLGLRLEIQKAPVDVIVIDHVDRPTSN